ncbi:MAG: SLC13 family permease [Acidobacteria bacterium]|nr:SLC13 family permease [Acidobacteriota bacterium]
MESHLILTLVILAVALIVFLTDRLSSELVALLVAVALAITGVLTPQEALSGFSTTAVITIMAVFILAEALRRSGVSDQVGQLLLKIGGKGEVRLTVIVMMAGAFLSLFMNNIAAAAVLLPAASGAAKKAGVNTSRILMPLAFGTILGGTATLLTTANIVINSLLVDRGLHSFSVTDFAWVGVPVTIAGAVYMALFGRRLLKGESQIERTQAPNTKDSSDLVAAYSLGQNLFRARVPDNSFLTGKTLAESTLREKFGVSVVAIERGGRRIVAPSPSTEIKDDDILVLEGNLEDFRKRDVEPYMEFLPTSRWQESDLRSAVVTVVEAMLAPRSRLIGETLRDANFREKYGLNVLAIWRRDSEITFGLADEPLQFGDAILLQGRTERIRIAASDPDLIVLTPKDETAVVPGKGKAAFLIFVLTLLLAATMPAMTGPIMLGGALVMMLTGILTTDQAWSSMGWRSVFLVAGMLPMGIALSKTNAAALLASHMVAAIGGFGSLALLASLFLVTALLVQTVNGAVVATVMGPLAISIAEQSGIDPRALAMGVAVAASMAFITPLGHPVNVLVMGPGGYSFRDFVRVGLPMAAILFVVSMTFLYLFWMR